MTKIDCLAGTSGRGEIRASGFQLEKKEEKKTETNRIRYFSVLLILVSLVFLPLNLVEITTSSVNL